MTELLRTNDLVLISVVESLLAGAGIDFFVADRYMSAMEGSLGFLASFLGRRRLAINCLAVPLTIALVALFERWTEIDLGVGPTVQGRLL